MDYQLAETLQILIAVLGGTTVAVTALRVWVRKKELDAGAGSGVRMEEAIESLRAEMDELRAEQHQQVVDLQERIDFAERLLTKGREGA